MNSPCINSNNLLTTVFRNFQCARRNLGYCPTTYMMLDAIIALLSLPFFCSQRPSKSLITVTRNLFSSSSCMAPDMLPMAQQSCLKKQLVILFILKTQQHNIKIPHTKYHIVNFHLLRMCPRFLNSYKTCYSYSLG